jgi:hypothetical protein
LIIKNAIGAVIAVGTTALLAVTVVPASASSAVASAATTRGRTIESCDAAGEHTACALNAQASHPLLMHAYLTATPNQVIKGTYTFGCSKTGHGAGEVGNLDSKGPLKLTLRPGFASPVSCSLSLQAHLPGSGKLQVSVTVTDKK